LKQHLALLAGSLLVGTLWGCQGVPSSAPAAPTIQSFDGDSGPGLAVCQAGGTNCGRQPEINVAANGKQVVQTTWQHLSVYDYDGKLLEAKPMAELIRGAGLDPLPQGGYPFEPHIVFNEFIQRWVISVSCSHDCLLVSSTPDARGEWRGIFPTCLQGGPCLSRNPSLKLGYDRNGVYFCAGHGGDENPLSVKGVGYDCFAIPSAQALAIGQGKEPANINRTHNLPLDIVPAVDHTPNKAPTDPAYFMNMSCARTAPNACQNSTNFPFKWLVNTFVWDGPTGRWNPSGAQQAVNTDVGSKGSKWLYNTPCCGEKTSTPQAGTAITLRTAGSHRVMNVMQVGDHLHGVLGSGPCTGESCGAQGTDTHNVMFYVDLDCSKRDACVVAQTAKISGPDFNPLFGSVGADDDGNVGIVASSVTATTNLSVMFWSHLKTDPPNTFRGPIMVAKGTQPHTCQPDKQIVPLGNTVGILTTRDPLDPKKFWTTQQWSNDARPCVFNTRIVGYKVAR
jgi:hypothetical protein